MPCEKQKKHGNPVRATSADKRQRMGVCIRKRIRMRRGFFAVGSPVDYRKGDPTGTVGTRLCPAKYSVLHRNNAVAQNRSFESPLRWQCSLAAKRANADTEARSRGNGERCCGVLRIPRIYEYYKQERKNNVRNTTISKENRWKTAEHAKA